VEPRERDRAIHDEPAIGIFPGLSRRARRAAAVGGAGERAQVVRQRREILRAELGQEELVLLRRETGVRSLPGA